MENLGGEWDENVGRRYGLSLWSFCEEETVDPPFPEFGYESTIDLTFHRKIPRHANVVTRSLVKQGNSQESDRSELEVMEKQCTTVLWNLGNWRLAKIISGSH
jgi:hypothetical protein